VDLEPLVGDRLAAAGRDSVGARLEAGLGALYGRQPRFQDLDPACVDLVLIEALRVHVAGLDPLVALLRAFARDRRKLSLDLISLAGEQLSGAILIHADTVAGYAQGVTSPEEAIQAIDERFGDQAGHRRLHAKGSLYTATFTATPEASRLTKAAHMEGEPTRATARLSNGSGDPNEPDYATDVRGLAVTFHLPDGSRTDISAQSLPRFPFKGVGPFIELIRISKPSLASAARMPLFLARNPGAIGALRVNLARLRPPQSYAAIHYYAIHAFRWIDADGGERFVRYTWKPTIELPDLGRSEAKERGRDYLREELVGQLEREPVRFQLEVQIAGPGDDPHDPSSNWPEDRERVVVGTLELTEPTEEGDDYVFDPTRVTDGIETSDDPVLLFRPRAYSISHERRTSQT
jgi:catalase